jgi:hypothetical protein
VFIAAVFHLKGNEMSSYGTIDNFLAYHELRGNEVPAAAIANDDLIASSLIVGSEWFDRTYLAQFDGYKTGGRDQEREFPRVGQADYYGYAIASDAIPREVEQAVYEATLIHLNTPGVLAVDYTPSKYKSVAVSGAVSVQYSEFNSSFDVQTKFSKIEQIVSQLFRKTVSNAHSGAVVRT